MKKFRKPLIIIFILVNVYAILCGGLYFFQDHLIFHPQQLPQDYDFNFEGMYDEVWVDAPDGVRLNGLHFTVTKPKGVVLYYHGNSGSLAQWGQIAQPFVQKGYAVIVMDYRQYGKSGGALSEAALYDDSVLWYAFAKAQYPTTPITSYGRSLGTTFATYVASKREVSKLVLEAPFYSILDEAQSRFSILPVERLLNYRLPTYSFVNEVKAPITIIHGTEDKVVAYEHGKALYDLITATTKRFKTVPGGNHHNLSDFEAYQTAIDALFE